MRLALEEDLEVVGEAGNVEEAIPLARDLRPDVVVMDVEIPGGSGLEAIEQLRAGVPHIAVVIFTLRDDAATRERARASGAAFVAKHRTEEMLLAAIRGARHGNQGKQHRVSASTQEEHTDDRRERRDS
jgi:DNA-binding NarL/FixJ family response regulator